MISSFQYSKLFFLVVLCCSSAVISAQTQDSNSEEDVPLLRARLAEFSLEYMTPQNSFGDRMNTSAVGGSATFMYQTKPEKPTFVGFDFYYGQFYRVSSPINDIVQSSRTCQ